MLVNAFMQDELVQTRNNINLAQLQMGITTLIAIIAGVLIARRITLQITRPLHSTLAMAERIAGGDLRRADQHPPRRAGAAAERGGGHEPKSAHHD